MSTRTTLLQRTLAHLSLSSFSPKEWLQVAQFAVEQAARSPEPWREPEELEHLLGVFEMLFFEELPV